MALQGPFFGKRDEPAPTTPPRGTSSSLGGTSSLGSASGASAQPFAAPSSASPAATATPTSESGAKLTVGPNIKLKGVEITDCDTLVVEGTVEATMNSRVIQIAEQGAFHTWPHAVEFPIRAGKAHRVALPVAFPPSR